MSSESQQLPIPSLLLRMTELQIQEIPTPSGPAPLLRIAHRPIQAEASMLLTPETCRQIRAALEPYEGSGLVTARAVPDLPPANGQRRRRS